MKSARIFLFRLIVCLLTVFTANGQNYNFRGLTMTEGLSDLLVNTIYKDKWGIVWLGTSNSVDRFDGIDFKHYTFNHANGKMKRVNAITETSNSRIWIGNNIGLWTLDNKTDALMQIGVGKLECPVYSLLYDGTKTLYVGTEKGLYLYTDQNLQGILLDQNEFSQANQIHGMAFDGMGNLWMTTPIGLYSYNLKNKKFFEYKDPEGKAVDLRHVVCLGGKLYLGTDKRGLFVFDIRKGTFSPYLSVGCDIISSLSSDGKDLLYVGTDGGGASLISVKQDKVMKTLRHNVNDRSSIRSNSIYSLLVDREGILWLGYYQSGVDYSLFQSGLFDTYRWGDFSTQNMAVRSFAVEGPYKVIGTRDGLYFVDEQKNAVHAYHKAQIHSDLIFSILYFRNEFYIGTYNGGLWILNPQTGAVRPFASSNPVFHTGTIFDMCTDSKGNLWAAASSGVYCCSGKDLSQVTEYTNRNSQLPEGQVYTVHFDSSGKGWFGTESGMAVYEPSSQSIKTNVFPDDFAHKEIIRSIYEDHNHRLYFLPDKGPLFTSSVDMKECSRIPLNPAIQSTAYMSVVQDRSGMLWLGCDNGLLSATMKDEAYSVYGFSDGLLSSIFSYGASYMDKRGTLWFGTGKGLVYLNPERLKKVERNPYFISITDICINGVSLTAEQRQFARDNGYFSMASPQKNLEFHFSSRTYTDVLSMGFEYKMDGVDDDWKVLIGKNVVSYYDLPSGDYEFHVRVMGVPRNMASCRIRIASGFPMWGWGALALAFVGVVAYLWIRRNSRKQKENVEKTLHPVTPEPAPEPVVVSVAETAVTGNATVQSDESVTAVSSGSEVKYKTNRLTEEECKLLSRKLAAVMKKEHPYTHPDLKIGDLAAAIGTSSPCLSYLFNQYLHQNYYDYVNEFRVQRFKELANDSKYAKYTLDAMAELCGFSSRASFFRSFKKSTGITPNEYLNSLK